MFLREEGDSNSRGRKTKGLAILRRSQAGPSSQKHYCNHGINISDKKVMSLLMFEKGQINY